MLLIAFQVITESALTNGATWQWRDNSTVVGEEALKKIRSVIVPALYQQFESYIVKEMAFRFQECLNRTNILGEVY